MVFKKNSITEVPHTVVSAVVMCGNFVPHSWVTEQCLKGGNNMLIACASRVQDVRT